MITINLCLGFPRQINSLGASHLSLRCSAG